MTAPAAPVPPLSAGALASVVQAVGALRNLRAMATLFGCLVAGIVIAMLASRIGGGGSFLGALILFVVGGIGFNGAGILLMDQARERPSRSVPDALVQGLACLPKLILLVLVSMLVAIVVFIALAIVFLICKIPFLGPILLVVAFPLSVVVAGVTTMGLFVWTVLAVPAIWEGLTVRRAIAQTLAIARTRLVETLLLLAVVGSLCMLAGFVVFAILSAGFMPTLGMSAMVLGLGNASGLGAMMGMMGGDGGSGYVTAVIIGSGVLWALSATLIGLVYLLGLNLVYLRSTEGLDADAAEGALLRGLDEAKRRTAELGEKARAAAYRDGDRGPAPPPLSAPVQASYANRAPPPAAPHPSSKPATIACPQCAAACTTDDLFCSVCGHRLK